MAHEKFRMKKFGIIVLIFVVLLAGIYLLAGLRPIQRFALGYGKKIVETQFGMELTVDNIKGNLFHHLTLKNVRIGSVMEARSLELNYNPFLLFRKRISISQIYIEQPVINIEEALKVKFKKGEGKPIKLNIGKFVMNHGKIMYKERKIDCSLQFSLRNNRLEVTHLTLNLPNSNFSTAGSYEFGGDMRLLNRLNIDLTDLGMREGTVASAGEVSGSMKNPLAKGNFELISMKFGKITLSYRYEDKTVYLNALSISGKRFQFSGDVRYSFISQDGKIFLSGNIANEKLSIEGLYMDNGINVNLKSRQGGISVIGKTGEAIDVSITGRYRNQPISGRLMYKNGIISGNLLAASVSLADASIKRMSAKFSFNVTEGKRKGNGEIAINDIMYSNSELGNLLLSVAMENDSVVLTLSGFVKGKGYISLQEPYPFLFSFLIEKFNLGSFLKQGSGFLTLAGNAKGELSTPKSSIGLVTIKDFLYEIRGLQASLVETLTLRFADKRVTINPARLNLSGQEVEIYGTLPILATDGLDFNITTEGFDLKVLSPVLPKRELFGQIDADIKVSGDVSEPQFFGNVKIGALSLITEGDTLGPVNCRVNLDQHSIKIAPLTIQFKDYVITNEDSIILEIAKKTVTVKPSQMRFGRDIIYFSGSIPMTNRGEADFNILTKGLDLKVLNLVIPHNVISGQLNADVRFSGELSRPQLSGEISIDRLFLAVDEDTVGPVNLGLSLDKNSIVVDTLSVLVKNNIITNDGLITVNLDKESISIQPSRVKLGEKVISFEGQLPLTRDTPVEFNFHSDSLDLSILSPIISGIELSGFLSLTVDVKGNLTKPEVFGNARLLSLLVITGRDTIGPVNGNLEFTQGYIRFRETKILYHEGEVVVSGNIGIDKDALLDIALKKIKITTTKRSEVGIDGDLHLTGRLGSSELEGEVQVTGSYIEPIEAQLIQRLLNRLKRPPKRLPEFLNKISLNIGVNTDFEVHNSAADIDVDGDLHISGTAAKQGITGRIRIVKGGRIGYLGRDFRIEEGSIDFEDPRSISPNLDINASREISYMGTDYLILLLITGPPEKIKIDLNSQPEMPTQEIIALVFSGQTRGVMLIPASQNIGEKGVGYLVERMKGRVENRIARTLGLERVSVTGTITDPALLKLGVEKRFVKRLKVSYTSGFENWRQPQVGFDYEINRNLSIYSMYDLENQDTGAGLDFHIKLW